jgi:hypothetical protein
MTITADDRLLIQELHHHYYLSTDNADVDGFIDCWASDRPILFESPFGDFADLDSLRAFETEHVEGGMAVGKRHYNLNLALRPGPDQDTVFATSYMVVLEVAGMPGIVATGIYRDSVVVRTASGWRFQKRSLQVDPGFAHVMAAQSPPDLAAA